MGDTDNNTADNVDKGNQQAGDGIAAYKFRRTIHGAEEGAFIFQFLTAGAGCLFINHASGQIGINSHLLAGHGVQREAGCYLGNPAGAFRDHHKIHNDQDSKNDDTDNKVAAHDKTAKGFNHITGGTRAGMTFR